MIVFDFIYFCIYSFVPDKAIFGKRDVACTFLSSFSAFLILGVFCFCIKTFKINIHFSLIGILILFSCLLILARIIFLKPVKFRSMHRRFRKIPKWLLKTIGIMYILFCFIGFIFLLIVSSFM